MNTKTRGFSRRQFLAGAGIVGAGMALTGCAPQASSSADETLAGTGDTAEIAWDYEADVVVLGGGAAGWAATVEAAKAGASVVLIEKSKQFGGDLVINQGLLGGHQTERSKKTGIGLDVTTDMLFEQFKEINQTQGSIPDDVAFMIFDESGNTIDWMDEQGVPWDGDPHEYVSYSKYPVFHQIVGGGGGAADAVNASIKASGAETLMETRAVELIENGEGRVIGVRAQKNGKDVYAKANRAVVLATGSYAANSKLIGAFQPKMIGVGHRNSSQNVGDGLIMAMAIGAVPNRNSMGPMMTPCVDVESGRALSWSVVQSGGIIVDADGKRFCSESLGYMTGEVTDAFLEQIRKQEKDYVWAVVIDSDNLEEIRSIYNPNLVEAKSVEELAGLMDVDPSVLSATVARYNELCEKGEDEDFGRFEYMIPIVSENYYACKVHPAAVVTTGGLRG